MCRSIKVLRKPDLAATPEELSGAALQFVRKISGFHKPSKANAEAFERAVQEIASSSERLLSAIASTPAPNRRKPGAASDTHDEKSAPPSNHEGKSAQTNAH